MKHDPEELKDVENELEAVIRTHRDILNTEPRIANPLKEARDAARIKYENATEGRGIQKARERAQ